MAKILAKKRTNAYAKLNNILNVKLNIKKYTNIKILRCYIYLKWWLIKCLLKIINISITLTYNSDRVGNQVRRFLTTKSYWQNFGTRHKFVANSKSWSHNLILTSPSRRSRWELSIGCRTRSRNRILGLQNRHCKLLSLHLLTQ